MELRTELSPPPVERQRVAELSREIERIERLLEAGDREAVESAVAAFNKQTGHDYDADLFATYWSSRSLADLATEAARPARPRVPDITRDELVEVVRRLLAGDPETDYYLRLLQANVPHPAVSALIYHPPAELADASAEQIVESALSYRPVAL